MGTPSQSSPRKRSTSLMRSGCTVSSNRRGCNERIGDVPIQDYGEYHYNHHGQTRTHPQLPLLRKNATNIMLAKRNQFEEKEFTNSVCELPNLQQVIAWYHAAAGYPTKTIWLKAIIMQDSLQHGHS